MNNLPKILLVVGAIVLAFLLGVVVGRHHQADVPGAAAAGVQISTEAPPAPPPADAGKLPTVPEAPPPAPVVKVDPKAQVNDDAAAVGMTTREDAEGASSPEPDAQSPETQPAPSSSPN